MSVKTRVVPVNGGVKAYERVQIENLKVAQRHMADSILARSKMLAPVLTGALRSDGRVEVEGTTTSVAYGDIRVPYARKRHFENKKNPHTKFYLKDAGDSVVKEGIKKWLKR